jgi:serine/threonine-protein kinase PknK
MVAWRERYEFVRELGEGASARVLLVRDLLACGAPRALKISPATRAEHLLVEHARLCAVEAQSLVRAREILLVPSHVGAPFHMPTGSVVLVEDVAPGESPRALELDGLSEAARTEVLVRIAEGALDALAALHAAGLVHGDVKPDNMHCAPDGSGLVLFDLGLCRPAREDDVVRGTPRMLAPEAWLGVCSEAQDVYALGACLYDLACGEPETGSDGRVLRPPVRLEGRVSRALAHVIALFLADALSTRPEHAFAARTALEAALGRPVSPWPVAEPRPAPRDHVGHAASQRALGAALGSASLIVVHGADGAGRSSLIRSALGRFQREAVAAGRSPPMVVRGHAGGERADEDVVVWLDAGTEDALAEGLRYAELTSVARPLGRATVLLETPVAPPAELAGESIPVDALDEVELGALLEAHLGRAPNVAELAGAQRASGGLGGRLCRAIARARGLGLPLAELDALPGEAPHAPSPDSQALAALLAWCGDAPELTAPLATLLGPDRFEAALAELTRGGWLRVGTSLTLQPELARAQRSATCHEPLVRGRVGELAARGALGPWAALLLDQPDAHTRLAREGEALRSARRLSEAEATLAEAGARLGSPELVRAAADVARARGRYAACLALLAPHTDPAARLLACEVLRLSGEPGAALAELPALALAPADRARAQALAARAHFDLGDRAAAHAALAALNEGAPLDARVRGAEVATLLVLGSEPARDRSELHVRLARELGEPRLLARALGLAAQVRSERDGRGRAALTEAVALAQTAGEAHEAATFALNLALWDFEEGELGSALAAFSEAAVELARIDRPRDRARVLVNFGAFALATGDIARAEQCYARGARGARASHDAAAHALAALGLAECAERAGRTSEALDRLAAAADEVRDTPYAFACVLRRARLSALREDHAAAAQALGAARALMGERAEQRVELAETALRCALLAGDLGSARQEAALLAGGEYAQQRFEVRMRAGLALREAALSFGDERARAELGAMCRGWLEQALRGLGPRQRATMRAIPEYARVLADSAAQLRAPRSESPTRALLNATRHWHNLDEPRALAQSLADVALQFVHAERALVVAEREPEGLVVVGQAGAFDERDPRSFSRTLVERVLADGQPIVSVDARRDVRLDDARSLHVVAMRSVLVVPLARPSGRAALYLDDRLRSAAFGAEEVALIGDLLELFRRALAALASLRRERARVRRARSEASVLEVALAEARSAPTQNAQRSGIVGQSAQLTRALTLAARVADSDLPVLIQGESGTGKELFARHVHALSKRAEQAFVAENCAALPETLLESALFGHVRGAFTGADRARRGLFELADGGTLFLDELGDTSPALQAKLLRTLQSGEFWPVGSERPRRSDVRVIAATSRDLEAAREAGQFRADLYYRLAGVTLRVPALRERRDDIPELALHLAAQVSPTARFTDAALRALVAAPWPGNVRELDNTVRRASVLAGAEPIEPSHLGLEPPQSERGGLHAEVDALTERLARDALERAQGNVTRAAELLGVSRFGLQKIMRRFELKPGSGRR